MDEKVDDGSPFSRTRTLYGKKKETKSDEMLPFFCWSATTIASVTKRWERKKKKRLFLSPSCRICTTEAFLYIRRKKKTRKYNNKKKKGHVFVLFCRFIILRIPEEEEKKKKKDDDDSLGLSLSDGPEPKKERNKTISNSAILFSTYPNWIGGRKKKEWKKNESRKLLIKMCIQQQSCVRMCLASIFRVCMNVWLMQRYAREQQVPPYYKLTP